MVRKTPIPEGALTGQEAINYLRTIGFMGHADASRILCVLPRRFVPPAQRLPAYNLFQIAQLSWQAFEFWCAQRLVELGWAVIITVGSADHGADLIAILGARRIAISCKHRSKPGKVVAKDMRELKGGSLEWGCQEAAIITNAFLTKPANESANTRRIPCHVISQNQILSLWHFPLTFPN